MPEEPDEASSSDLCVSCGLCCGDGMFSQVRLHGGERARLKARGGQPEALPGEFMALPCTFLRGTSCTIYPDRPQGCRAYRCKVLKALEAGTIPVSDAQLRVREARVLLARLRGAMPEGVSLEMAGQRWQPHEGGIQPIEPGEAQAQLAFFAYYRFMDRHFLPPHKAKLAWGAETRPER